MNLITWLKNKIIDLKYNNEETSETESNPLDDINIIEYGSGYESQNLREDDPPRRSEYRDVGDRGELGVASPSAPPPKYRRTGPTIKRRNHPARRPWSRRSRDQLECWYDPPP